MSIDGHRFPVFPTVSQCFPETVQKAIGCFPLGGIAPRGATLPGNTRLRNPETAKTMKNAVSVSQQRETPSPSRESPRPQTDADGDRWPITGHLCRICRWPLHPIHARQGDDTHPACDTRPPDGDLYTTPTRSQHRDPADPGYCHQCGMTRPSHTTRCPTRKETR